MSVVLGLFFVILFPVVDMCACECEFGYYNYKSQTCSTKKYYFLNSRVKILKNSLICKSLSIFNDICFMLNRVKRDTVYR